MSDGPNPPAAPQATATNYRAACCLSHLTVLILGPIGAVGCSHGWSDAALSVAQPVESVTEILPPAPTGAEEA